MATLFALAESAKGFVWLRLQGAPGLFALRMSLIGSLPWWYAWAALTPIIVWLANRWRLDDDHGRLASVTVHVVLSTVIGVTHLLVIGALYQTSVIPELTAAAPDGGAVPTLQSTLSHWVGYYLIVELFTYWAIVVAYYAMDFSRRYRESALMSLRLQSQASQLQARMTEARMQALRMELNPHFLFNTLNSIATYVRKRNNDGAVQMLARLGDLLRATVDRDLGQETPLASELGLLELYLGIERIRFGDRLSIVVDADGGCRAALVPTFILQPLVENAIRHGIAHTPGPGEIRITAHARSSDLVIEVRDTGLGLHPSLPTGRERDGIGISNARARLEQLYGRRASLSLTNAVGGGAVATIVMPFRTARQRQDDEQ